MGHKVIKEEGYTLHIIKNKKFKKNIIKINYKTKLNDEDIEKRKIIPNILVESNSIYDTRRLLNIKREELYNLQVFGGVTFSGNACVTSITATFLNDKYAPNLFNDAAEFVSNLMYKPKVVDNHFDDKAFKMSCDLLCEEVDEAYENPGAYAMEQVYKILGKGTSLEYPVYGRKEKIRGLKNNEVYQYYLDMLENDKVDIFVAGNIDDSVIDVIKKYFKIKNKRKDVKHYITFNEFNDEYKEYKETKEYNQSKLIIGYRLEELTSFEKQYVMPIYSFILGGGADSKLFQNVREKNSLCYNISSRYLIVSNILLITSGINASAYEKALKIIKEQVESMAKGEFDTKDIDKAKITYLSVFDEMNDSLFSILDDYNTNAYLKTDLVNTRKKKILEVTKKDILNVIPKIHPCLVYLLEGSKEDGKESTE